MEEVKEEGSKLPPARATGGIVIPVFDLIGKIIEKTQEGSSTKDEKLDG